MPTKGVPERKSRREIVREQQQKSILRTRLIIVGVFVLLALIIIYALANANKAAKDITAPQPVTRTTVNGMTAGDPNAKVVVEDFSDFNCVHCADFATGLEHQLIEEYINTGKILFKYVPMSFISDYSGTATQAVLCANDQNKFWEYHDVLFANYGRVFTNTFLNNVAENLGLDKNTFNSCMTSNKYAAKVTEYNNYATQNGITSTPTFLVNGVKTDRGSLLQVIETQLNLK